MYLKDIEKRSKQMGFVYEDYMATGLIVSYKPNNWLKLHGYPMRRRARNKKAHRAAVYKFYMSEEWRAIVRRFAPENERG